MYYRLQPKRAKAIDGKRHVKTVPVRLSKASNDYHQKHVDTEFCKAGIRYLEGIASSLGPEEVIFLSQDDKARVPIGIAAANKQAPLLMHTEYRVRLHDHDWVVADKHKLIPSVYAFVEVEKNKMGDPAAVKYSGPTYIAIRSGKHDSSTAASHAYDLNSILQNEEFSSFTRTKDGELKPVIIIISDGGPDENPRYAKVINQAISHFKKNNFDAVFVATNAPGRSAFNRVERRMAPLSRELCGLILPYEFHGSHLNHNRETVDIELEKKNFEKAGDVLAEIWSSVVIDGYKTTACYIDPGTEYDEAQGADARWKTNHIREGHYFLQIVKCDDRNCCSAPRSSLFSLINRFVPAPLCYEQGPIRSTDNTNEKNNFTHFLFQKAVGELSLISNKFDFSKTNEIPFDLCCPSLSDLLSKRSCTKCGQYFSSMKSVNEHLKFCVKNTTVQAKQKVRPLRVAAKRQKEKMIVWTSRLNDQHADWFDNDEIEDDDELNNYTSDVQISTDPMPIVPMDLFLQCPWENC